MSTVNIGDSTKDELFILGRNIYQASCDRAVEVIKYVDALALHLRRFEREISFHILNGILYEIYFDSQDRYRRRIKTVKMEQVFLLEDAEEFRLSFDFIRQSLIPYQKYLSYMPGLRRAVVVDIVLADVKGEHTVKGVFIDGQDVFYANDGKTLIASIDTPLSVTVSLDKFEKELIEKMAIPRRRLKITYSPSLTNLTHVVVPYDFRIQRISACDEG